jgi:tRNA A58 N-methylase Trm61
VEVAEQDCRLRAGDDQDDEDQEQEAVHVVDLRRPENAIRTMKNNLDKDFIMRHC